MDLSTHKEVIQYLQQGQLFPSFYESVEGALFGALQHNVHMMVFEDEQLLPVEVISPINQIMQEIALNLMDKGLSNIYTSCLIPGAVLSKPTTSDEAGQLFFMVEDKVTEQLKAAGVDNNCGNRVINLANMIVSSNVNKTEWSLESCLTRLINQIQDTMPLIESMLEERNQNG